MKKETTITRRRFINKTVAGVLGIPILSRSLIYAAPSDRVRVAVIGLGSQGRSHMNWFNALRGAEVAALCDLDRLRLEEAMKQLQSVNPGTRADI